MGKVLLTRKCPECLDRGILTEWWPGPGQDSRMRQFICCKCGLEFYKILGEKVIDKLNNLMPQSQSQTLGHSMAATDHTS